MMEDPQIQRPPHVISPCSSGRRSSTTNSNSPEFEFWMVRNPPSDPQPNLLSADELFSGGVLLPLHLLRHHSSDYPPDQNQQEKPSEQPGTSGSDQPPCSGPDVSSVLAGVSAPTSSSSKRWKDIFKISSDRRSSKGSSNGEDGNNSSKAKEKEKKKEKKFNGGGGGNGGNVAELKINIWPFSRSRSAGNAGSRPRAGAGATRKVSSAPCSRSNSASESKSRKWPSSPSRGGVYLGRSSPVWQVRHRAAAGAGVTKVSFSDLAAKNGEKGVTKKEASKVRRKIEPAAVSGDGAASGVGVPKAKALTLNVPMRVGYKHHLSCRSDENSAVGAGSLPGAAAGSDVVHGGGSDEAVHGSNLFSIRSLFTKKVL